MSIYDTVFLEKARDCLKEHRADPSHWQALHDAASLIDMAIAEASRAQVDQTFELPSASKAIRPRFASRSATHPRKSRECWPNSRFPSRVAPTSRASTPTFSPHSELPLRFSPNVNPRYAQRLRAWRLSSAGLGVHRRFRRLHQMHRHRDNRTRRGEPVHEGQDSRQG